MTVIKRYSNRKLYDTEAARYITLEEMGDRVSNGEEFSVVDHTTGADLTAVTLMQVMFEREKKIGGMLPKAIVTSLIQAGNMAVGTLRNSLASTLHDPTYIEQEISRRLKILAADGLLATEDLQRLGDLLLSPRWRQQQETQEIPVKDPNSANPEEVESLLKQVDDLEQQIAAIKAQKQMPHQ